MLIIVFLLQTRIQSILYHKAHYCCIMYSWLAPLCLILTGIFTLRYTLIIDIESYTLTIDTTSYTLTIDTASYILISTIGAGMSMKKLALIQLATEVGHIDKNYAMVREAILKAAEGAPHIIVLPETWNTGFYPTADLIKEADANGDRTQEFLKELAQETHCHIVGGSVSTVKDSQVYNTTYIVNHAGEVISSYDKVHCFSPAKEDVFYAGGMGVHKFMLDDLACSSITCYDIRFPELVRMAALQHIDILFVPAQWPTSRLAHWRILNQARAIENQMFVCAINGCGAIGRATMAGHSLVIDPFGEILLELDSSPSIQYVMIDPEVIKPIREKINVFKDRRPELYKL